MKTCPKCNASAEDYANVCGYCGTRFASAAAPYQTPYQAPAAPQAPAYNPNRMPYQTGPAVPQAPAAPYASLRTNYSGAKVFWLSVITLGIYPLVTWTKAVNDVNTVCSPHDGKKTMHYCILIFFCYIFTLGICPLVWNHRVFGRVGAELKRRGIESPSLSSGDFWLWGFLLCVITLGIPYKVKFFKAVNALNADYNVRG